jgi:division protein CdvB (Snf7/Vps24/ESCRT-III family)
MFRLRDHPDADSNAILLRDPPCVMRCEQFEKAFEDTDVMAQTVQGTMDNSTAMSTPANEVEDLLKQLADEAQLDMSAAFPNAQGVRVPAQAAPAEEEVR